jgi:hypothetical protein
MLPIGAIAPANAYQPRCADAELVYRVVAAELDGFLDEAEARSHPLPFPLRYRLAYGRTLLTPLLAA